MAGCSLHCVAGVAFDIIVGPRGYAGCLLAQRKSSIYWAEPFVAHIRASASAATDCGCACHCVAIRQSGLFHTNLGVLRC